MRPSGQGEVLGDGKVGATKTVLAQAKGRQRKALDGFCGCMYEKTMLMQCVS